MTSIPLVPPITTDQRFTRDVTTMSRLLADGGRMSDAQLAAEAQRYADRAAQALELIPSATGRALTRAIWYAGLEAARALYLENLLEDRGAFRRDVSERMAARFSPAAEAGK